MVKKVHSANKQYKQAHIMNNDMPAKSIETKPCISCKEPIRINAIKCFHCEQFQNWKRHLVFSGIVLSLLIALFSVIGVVTPIVQKAFITERASLKLAVISGNYNKIQFMLSNLGKRSAVISEVTIVSDIKGNNKSDILYPDILGKVIEPDKSYSILTITKDQHIIPSAIPPIIAAISPKAWKTCYLVIQVIHFDGAVEIQKLPFKCTSAID